MAGALFGLNMVIGSSLELQAQKQLGAPASTPFWMPPHSKTDGFRMQPRGLAATLI